MFRALLLLCWFCPRELLRRHAETFHGTAGSELHTPPRLEPARARSRVSRRSVKRGEPPTTLASLRMSAAARSNPGFRPLKFTSWSGAYLRAGALGSAGRVPFTAERRCVQRGAGLGPASRSAAGAAPPRTVGKRSRQLAGALLYGARNCGRVTGGARRPADDLPSPIVIGGRAPLVEVQPRRCLSRFQSRVGLVRWRHPPLGWSGALAKRICEQNRHVYKWASDERSLNHASARPFTCDEGAELVLAATSRPGHLDGSSADTQKIPWFKESRNLCRQI